MPVQGPMGKECLLKNLLLLKMSKDGRKVEVNKFRSPSVACVSALDVVFRLSSSEICSCPKCLWLNFEFAAY